VTRHGVAGAPVALSARPLQDGEVAVDVTAAGVRDVWGAELHLKFDPSKVEVVDAQDRPGVQIEAGDAWNTGGTAWIAVNEVDSTSGTISYVASRLKPSEPLSGNVVLATIRLRLLDGATAENAVWLAQVTLADSKAQPVDVRFDGVDIRAIPAERVFMPAVMNKPTD
jgi:hypothetical protein